MELDLRTKACVTPVKDQAVCGSCWAFGAAGVLEGRINFQNRLNQKPMVRVSAQQIMSCAWVLLGDDNNLGCAGGDPNLAINQIISTKGGKFPLESEAPYLGVEDMCDNTSWTSEYGTIESTIVIDSALPYDMRKQQMKEALTQGPVAIGIAVPQSMPFYAGGVFNDPQCGYGPLAQIDHIVTCVGWGNDVEYGDYWIVRNSWSNAWGMDGYIYIASNALDLCGVLQSAVYYQMMPTAPPPQETEYYFNGTFNLPYSNLSEQIEVWYDLQGQRERVSFFNETDYTIWDLNNPVVNNSFWSVRTWLPRGANAS